MRKIIMSSLLMGLSINVNAEGEFTELQLNSQRFVTSTCMNPGEVNSNDADQLSIRSDFQTICNSMVSNSRQLNDDTLAGGFQNIVPEETLAPIAIAVNTSSINLAAINSRLAKIRLGTGAGDDDLFSSSRLGFFINGTGGFGETDQTNELDASDFDSKGVISGIDYKLSENWIVGLAGAYSFFDLNFDQNVDVARGSIESDNYSVTVYGNYAQGGGYIDSAFTYGWSDYDISRGVFIGSNNEIEATTVNRFAFASPEGEQLSASLAAGYDFYSGPLTYGSFAKIMYFDTEIDGYDETGAGGMNLHVNKHEAESLESILGAQMSYAWSQSWGVLIPQVRAEWHHEFLNNSRSYDVTFLTDSKVNKTTYRSTTDAPDRDFANLSAGVSAVLKHGMQVFIDYETIVGLSDIEAHKFSAGVRMEF